MLCPVCRRGAFQVLRAPKDVLAEQEWLSHLFQQVLPERANLKDKASFTQSEATYIVRCTECGTVLRNPQPCPADLAQRYEADRYGKRTLEELFENERAFYRAKAETIELPKGSRILEVGSFVGAFLEAAQARGWRATGLDIGGETAEFCRSRGLEVIESTIEDSGLPKGCADAIFIWNTFDQLAQPRIALRACRKVLAKNGLLVIRIPNGDFETALAVAQLEPKWKEAAMHAAAFNNFLTFPYLFGYTSASLGKLLKEEGFSVQKIGRDTMLPLFGSGCPESIVRQEGRWKRRVTRFCNRFSGTSILHPWLDVYARYGA